MFEPSLRIMVSTYTGLCSSDFFTQIFCIKEEYAEAYNVQTEKQLGVQGDRHISRQAAVPMAGGW